MPSTISQTPEPGKGAGRPGAGFGCNVAAACQWLAVSKGGWPRGAGGRAPRDAVLRPGGGWEGRGSLQRGVIVSPLRCIGGAWQGTPFALLLSLAPPARGLDALAHRLTPRPRPTEEPNTRVSLPRFVDWVQPGGSVGLAPGRKNEGSQGSYQWASQPKTCHSSFDSVGIRARFLVVRKRPVASRDLNCSRAFR